MLLSLQNSFIVQFRNNVIVLLEFKWQLHCISKVLLLHCNVKAILLNHEVLMRIFHKQQFC